MFLPFRVEKQGAAPDLYEERAAVLTIDHKGGRYCCLPYLVTNSCAPPCVAWLLQMGGCIVGYFVTELEEIEFFKDSSSVRSLQFSPNHVYLTTILDKKHLVFPNRNDTGKEGFPPVSRRAALLHRVTNVEYLPIYGPHLIYTQAP